MAHFVAVALSFPSVVFTVLLGVAVVYWISVLVGAARINLLGDGVADGAAEGLDGADPGGADGAHDGHDLDGHEGLAEMMAALKLRSAPATVVLSCLVLFAWVLSMFAVGAAEAWLPAAAMGVARGIVLLVAPVLALLPTSIAVRPLARVFVPEVAAEHADLVGKVCTIRTGTVTDRFGEATLEDGGAGVVVRVRVETGEALARGDQAIIVGYDEDKQEFTVAPMAAADEALRRR